MNIEFINNQYTEDELRLPMIHFIAKEKDTCVIFIHGMCANFLDNYFASVIGKELSKENIGFIYAYNRGHDIENDLTKKDGSILRCGTMYEIFEDSLKDIALFINAAKKLGYKKLILLGHSYGCNKVIYYAYQKHPDLLGIILASIPDMVGIHKLNQANFKDLLNEAKHNIDEGNSNKLLSCLIEDYMYMSSKTYYNWYNDNTNLDNAPILGFSNSWKQFSSLDYHILTFSGNNEEEYYKKHDLLKEKAISAKTFTSFLIDDTGHTYNDKEIEIAKIIKDWIKELWKK